MIIDYNFFVKYKNEIDQAKIILQDDGHGVYIKFWDSSLGKIPSQTEIDRLYSDYEVIKYKNRLANTEIYEKLNEVDLKSIRALRTGDTSRLESLEQEAIALRAQLVK